jgi:hypothetical protein
MLKNLRRSRDRRDEQDGPKKMEAQSVHVASFSHVSRFTRHGLWPLADFFSILLQRKRELGQFSLLKTLLHQRPNIEHPFDLLNVIEFGFRAGVRWGEE